MVVARGLLRGPVAPPTSSARVAGAPRWHLYLLALSFVALSTLFALIVEPYASIEDEAMIYLLSDTLAALRFEPKISVFTALLSILACDFFFIPPRMAFAWTDARKTLTFLAILVVSAVVSGLSQRLRMQERTATRAAQATQTLYELNVELSSSAELPELAAVTKRRLQRVFGGEAQVLLRKAEGTLERPPLDLTPAELALAERAWLDGVFSAEPPNGGYAVWLPVLGKHEGLAVIGLKLATTLDPSSEQGVLLSACARELAAAIERTQLAHAIQRAELAAETERMRSSLLSAVSHDLKTPLAGIVASGTTLLEHQATLAPQASRGLVSTIVREGERLGQLLQNLLSMSRLESTSVKLRTTPEAVEDIVSAALTRLADALSGRSLTIELPHDLPWVQAEPALVEQVLLNLLENALRYTAPSSSIWITAFADDAFVTLQVADSGPGIAESEREKVFEQFFRGAQANKRDGGVGLGLSICRAVVRAHGGEIGVRERHGGGTLVQFTLPLSPPVRLPLEGCEASV